MFVATFDPDFTELAIEEIQRADASAQMLRELAPGVVLIECGETWSELTLRWRESPPVFIRHVCPVTLIVNVDGTADDLPRLEGTVTDNVSPQIDSHRTFSVQTRVLAGLEHKPYDINTRIASALSSVTGASLNVRQPEQVVSIVCADAGGTDRYAAYVGHSCTRDNLSDWAGGMRRYAREPDQVSRSEFKLLEALEVLHVDLPPRGVALDLGAAPGGWTRILRQRTQYVTAVDPGDLHAALKQDPGVRHLKITAEEYLHRGPDTYDLIVNDMRMDARDSARLMVQYAAHLYPGGQVLMTLKLPERNRKSVIEHSLAILRQAYYVAGAKQLFHNRSEITVYLLPRIVDEKA